MPILNTTLITPPRVTLIDQRTGYVTRPWFSFLFSLYERVTKGDSTARSSSVGFRGTPSTEEATGRLMTLGDAGCEVVFPVTGGAGEVFTIPSSAAVEYDVGSDLWFTNLSANTLDIAIDTDTMYLVGTVTTGTRTLGPNSRMQAHKVAPTVWLAIGYGSLV